MDKAAAASKVLKFSSASKKVKRHHRIAATMTSKETKSSHPHSLHFTGIEESLATGLNSK